MYKRIRREKGIKVDKASAQSRDCKSIEVRKLRSIRAEREKSSEQTLDITNDVREFKLMIEGISRVLVLKSAIA